MYTRFKRGAGGSARILAWTLASLVSMLPGTALGEEAARAKVSCPPLDEAGLDKIAQERGGQVHIVFFASWCSSCRKQLVEASKDTSILIGVFDKRERLEAAATALGVVASCYTGDELAKTLGVTSLPREMDYKPAPQHP